MNKKPIYFLLSVVVTLAGCKTVPTPPTENIAEYDKMLAEQQQRRQAKPLTQLPQSVQNELMSQRMNDAKDSLLAEKRLDIGANQVPAADFFAAIVEDSSYSIAVHPDVSGEITLNLKEVTVNETLDVVQQLYGYDISRLGKVIQVYPAGMRTETIPLNYLFVRRNGLSSTSVNSGGVSDNDPDSNGNNSNNSNNNSNSNSHNNRNSNSGNQNPSGVNIFTENESDYWKELQETLSLLVGVDGGRSVIVSPQAGLVTVRAFPAEIRTIRKFIEQSEEHLRRQVIIEAKIMEVTLNDDYQQGIRWNQVVGSIGSTHFDFGTTGGIAGNIISSTIGGTSSLSFRGSDFEGVIELLQTQGNVQVLSSPRITATNNQKAVIKVGSDEYFVTEVSSTTTTGTSTTTTPEIELTPFFSGIALDVTPQIDAKGEVILHVHPSVSETEEQLKTISFDDSDFILPLAQSNVRESDTVIKAESGEIVVIGGLIETHRKMVESKTPLLGDIPIMGELFKSKAETTLKKELVIMLKPIVIGTNTWEEQLQQARSLLKQWFPENSN